MTLAFLCRHRNEQEPEQSNNAPFSNLHASPRAESAEASFNDSQADRLEGAISIHSLARPLEEFHFWDASPPPSPSVGAAEDTVNSPSQHSLARPHEELVFKEKMKSDSPPTSPSASSNAIPWLQVDQAVEELDRRLGIQHNSSRVTSQALTRLQLKAIQEHRVACWAQDVVGDHDDTVTPEAASSRDMASLQHSLAQPLDHGAIYERFEDLGRDPSSSATLYRRHPLTWCHMPLARRRVGNTTERTNNQQDAEYTLVASDLAAGSRASPPHSAISLTSFSTNLPVAHETDRTESETDRPSHLWQHTITSEDEAHITRWLELTASPIKRND